MNKGILVSSLVILLFASAPYLYRPSTTAASSLVDGKTLVLYDAASGKTPDPSVMSFTAFPADTVFLAYSDGVTILDTTISGTEPYAGWVSSAAMINNFPILDRRMGVQVNFTLQLEWETHVNSDRAGFSLILLDKEAKGIELAFWENEIWAQNDAAAGGLFTHGEGVPVETTAGPNDYQVTLLADTYTLRANGVVILTGAVRDYSSFEGLLDPYQIPNFLFLGDNTTSAQARVRLGFVSITGTEPVPLVNTATSTNLPQPTAFFTPAPPVTLAPSVTSIPLVPALPLCSFGWLFVTVILSAFLLIGKNRF